MKKITVCAGITLLLWSSVVGADEITVSAASVTQIQSVDPGLKTFSQAPLSTPVTRTIDVGASFSLPVFELFTNESKVNTEEEDPGDETPLPISASLTIGAPINATLTFHGKTFGQADLSVIPANLRPILDKENPTTLEALALLQWGLANPDLANIAGGRGVVKWEGAQTLNLGAGKILEVKIEDAFYNEGLQFERSGPGNAGTVMMTATLKQSTETDRPTINGVEFVGNALEIRFPTKVGYSYQVQKTVDAKTWAGLEILLVGTGDEMTFSVPRSPGMRELLVRVVRMAMQ